MAGSRLRSRTCERLAALDRTIFGDPDRHASHAHSVRRARRDRRRDGAEVNLVANADGRASWPSLPIPNNPAVGGASFFDQSIWLDPAANAAGLVTSQSSRWTVGTNRGGLGAFVSATGRNAMNPRGTVLLEEMPTFQLRY